MDEEPPIEEVAAAEKWLTSYAENCMMNDHRGNCRRRGGCRDACGGQFAAAAAEHVQDASDVAADSKQQQPADRAAACYFLVRI